jgi:TatD DNase family protein
VGLDYAKCPLAPEIQKKTFTAAIELSLQVNKPLIVHCRNAYSDLLPILRRFFTRHSRESGNDRSPGVIHCFSGNKEEAHELISMGFYLGVDGPITYPNSDALRAALADCPLESLVLETDSPYLPPQTHRGQRNEPSHLPAIGKYVAMLRRQPVGEVAAILTANSVKLFRLNRLD